MKHLHTVLLVLLLLLMVFLRWQFLDIAMERDEGIYTYIGHLILQGKVPYIDFYETRFAGIFYMYALLVAIFGYSIKGVAIGILVLNIGAALFLYDIVRRLFSKTAGLIAVASFVFLTLAPIISGFTRQSEHIVNFWSLFGFWLLTIAIEKGKVWQYFLSGICICMAMLVKPNAIYFIPAAGLILAAHELLAKPIQWKRLIINGLSYSFGVAAMFGLMCLYLYSKGAWNQFYQFAIVEAGKYAESFDKELGKTMLFGVYRMMMDTHGVLLILSIVGLVATWISSLSLFKKITVSLLFIFGFLTITPGWRFVGHYWIMWMPFIALSIGAGAFALQNVFANRLKLVAFGNYIPALFAIPLLIHLTANKSYYFSPNFTKILESTYNINPFSELKRVGDFLAKRSKPGDKMALVGSEPELYVYTKNDSPTKHAYFTYLMLDTIQTPAAKVWQAEYKADVEREKPRFIVFASHRVSVSGNRNSDMRFFDWFFPYIEANYNRIGCVEFETDDKTTYHFDPTEIKTFKPVSKYYIDVLERKQ